MFVGKDNVFISDLQIFYVFFKKSSIKILIVLYGCLYIFVNQIVVAK